MRYIGARALQRVAVDESRPQNGISGRRSGRDFPGFEARVEVEEYVDRVPENDQVAEFYEGTVVTIKANDVDIMTRNAPGLDGVKQ